MKIKLTIAYNGAAYCGWQAQSNAVSVQSTLTRVISEVYKRPCLVTGSSRTDSGVHARAYVCTVESADGSDVSSVIPASAIPRAINSRLEDDIAVISAELVPDDFHARYSVRSKTYEYVFYDSDVRSPFMSGLAYSVPPITNEVLLKMDACARKMCGTHDFASFMATGSKIKDTVRTVYECKVFRRNETVVFSVSADGFLYNMVRIMAGTVYAAALGRISSDDIDGIIAARDRKRAGQTLPPHGLYLCRVEY